MLLSHLFQEHVAFLQVHAFLSVLSEGTLLLLQPLLSHVRHADDCLGRWQLYAKTFLFPLLRASPFFPLMAYKSPESICLNTTQLMRNNKMLLDLLHLCLCSFQPTRDSFLLYSLNTMNSS